MSKVPDQETMKKLFDNIKEWEEVGKQVSWKSSLLINVVCQGLGVHIHDFTGKGIVDKRPGNEWIIIPTQILYVMYIH